MRKQRWSKVQHERRKLWRKSWYHLNIIASLRQITLVSLVEEIKVYKWVRQHRFGETQKLQEGQLCKNRLLNKRMKHGQIWVLS